MGSECPSAWFIAERPGVTSAAAKTPHGEGRPPWRFASPVKGLVLGRPKFSDGDELVLALETGDSWHRVSKVTKIPYSTVKKHARVPGYKPRQRISTLTAAGSDMHG